MGNTWGHSLRVTTFGESHGGGVGVVIDGLPAGVEISLEKVQEQLGRRRPGQSSLSSPRQEADELTCYSGIEDGYSLGSPIMLMVANLDKKPKDYQLAGFRPSHADFTTFAKYGRRAKSGGGRSSARETIGRVAAGAVAEQFLQKVMPGFQCVAFVEKVHRIAMNDSGRAWTREDVDSNEVRCPEATSASAMSARILEAKAAGDTVGGVIRCQIRGVMAGLGEPVFDKLEAELAKAMMSLPASKGFEIGSGFAGTEMTGSEHNDAFVRVGGETRTRSNHSGGIQGGISNGEMIDMRVAFKPVSTIFKDQDSVDESGQEVKLRVESGRHDPCVLPRAVPMVEAMASLVIADMWLRQLRHATR